MAEKPANEEITQLQDPTATQVRKSPCPICGEPRGDETPCPHCGMR